MNTMHLSDDQIDAHLIGDLAPEAAAHLATCAECQQKASAIEAPLASFREISLAWAERRSATMPLPTQPRQHRLAWASAGAFATAALAFGIALPHLLHHDPAQAPTTLASVEHVPSAEELARDNAMLDAIDNTLNAPIAAPVSMQRHGRAPANQTHD